MPKGAGPKETASSLELFTHLCLAICISRAGRIGCQLPPERIRVHCGVATLPLGHQYRWHCTVWGWIDPDGHCHHLPFLAQTHTWDNKICRKRVAAELAHGGFTMWRGQMRGISNDPAILDIYAWTANVPQGDGNAACYLHRAIWGTWCGAFTTGMWDHIIQMAHQLIMETWCLSCPP